MDTQMLLNGLVGLGYNFALESEDDGEINISSKETDKIISVQYNPAEDMCSFVIAASVIATKTVTQNEISSLMRKLSYHSGKWDCRHGNARSEYFVFYQCTLGGDPLESAKLVIGTYNYCFEDVVRLFSSQNTDEKSPLE